MQSHIQAFGFLCLVGRIRQSQTNHPRTKASHTNMMIIQKHKNQALKCLTWINLHGLWIEVCMDARMLGTVLVYHKSRNDKKETRSKNAGLLDKNDTWKTNTFVFDWAKRWNELNECGVPFAVRLCSSHGWIITILFDARDSIPNECQCFYIDWVFVLLFSEYVIVAQCITLAFPRSHSRLGSIRLISCQLLCTVSSEVRILPHSFHFMELCFVQVYRFSVAHRRQWLCRQRCLCNLCRSNVLAVWQKLDNCHRYRQSKGKQ